jgi:cellulose synthase operon protein C
MVEIGRAADAMKYHKKGYPLIRRNPSHLWHWGDHMAYLSLTGNDARAVKLLEKHLPDVEASHDPLASLAFFRNMLIVVETLAEKKDRAKLRLPSESPFAHETGEYVLADLATQVRQRAVELSRRFDKRNGNRYYVGLVEEASKLRKKTVPVPLSR